MRTFLAHAGVFALLWCADYPGARAGDPTSRVDSWSYVESNATSDKFEFWGMGTIPSDYWFDFDNIRFKVEYYNNQNQYCWYWVSPATLYDDGPGDPFTVHARGTVWVPKDAVYLRVQFYNAWEDGTYFSDVTVSDWTPMI